MGPTAMEAVSHLHTDAGEEDGTEPAAPEADLDFRESSSASILADESSSDEATREIGDSDEEGDAADADDEAEVGGSDAEGDGAMPSETSEDGGSGKRSPMKTEVGSTERAMEAKDDARPTRERRTKVSEAGADSASLTRSATMLVADEERSNGQSVDTADDSEDEGDGPAEGTDGPADEGEEGTPPDSVDGALKGIHDSANKLEVLLLAAITARLFAESEPKGMGRLQ